MIRDITSSLSDYIEAFGAIGKYRLWTFTIKSGIVSLYIGLGLMFVSYFLSGLIAGYIADWIPSGISILTSIIKSLIMLVVLLGFVYLYKHILYIVLGGYMGKMSLIIEERLKGSVEINQNSSVRLFLGNLSFEIRLIFRELFWILLLMILGVVPVLGLVIPVLIFVVQSYFAGSSTIGAYFAARKYRKFEIVKNIKQNKGVAIGNGMIFLALLLVPIFGLFFAPSLSITAFTLHEIKKNGS